MEEKLGECIAVMQDNSEKTKQLVYELEKERAESKSKDKIIKWLCAVIMAGVISASIVAGMFIYGYMYSPYLASEINANGADGGNGVVSIR